MTCIFIRGYRETVTRAIITTSITLPSQIRYLGTSAVAEYHLLSKINNRSQTGRVGEGDSGAGGDGVVLQNGADSFYKHLFRTGTLKSIFARWFVGWSSLSFGLHTYRAQL